MAIFNPFAKCNASVYSESVVHFSNKTHLKFHHLTIFVSRLDKFGLIMVTLLHWWVERWEFLLGQRSVWGQFEGADPWFSLDSLLICWVIFFSLSLSLPETTFQPYRGLHQPFHSLHAPCILSDLQAGRTLSHKKG